MKDFKEYFTKEDFNHMHQSILSEEDSKEAIKSLFKSVFQEKLKLFCIDLTKDSRLVAPGGYENSDLIFLKRVKSLANEENKNHAAEYLARQFGMNARLELDRLKDNLDENQLNEIYERIVKQYNDGNFEYFDLNAHEKCRLTDTDVSYKVKNWTIEPIAFDKDFNAKPFFPVDDPSIKINKISLVSGHLLVGEWISIEALNKQVFTDEYYDQPSINTVYGKDFEQNRLAEKFNLFSINVRDFSPELFEKDGVAYAGWLDDESGAYAKAVENGYRFVAGTSLGSGSVMIIDKAQLIKLVANVEGDNAANIVEEYIKKHDVSEFHVKPGDYYSYSTGDVDNFVQMMGEYDVDLSDFESLKFVLSDHELPLKQDHCLGM